jgi:plasmid maintenance system antidote protein VapI
MSEIKVSPNQAKKSATKPIKIVPLSEILNQKRIREIRLDDSVYEDLANAIGMDFTKRRFHALMRDASTITLKEAVVLTKMFGATVHDLIQPETAPLNTDAVDKFLKLK